MSTGVDFQSDLYEKIYWKDIFYQSGISVSKTGAPIAPVNVNGIVMMTDAMFLVDRVLLCFRNDDVEIVTSHFKPIFFSSLQSDILFFKMDIAFPSSNKISNEYFLFVAKIIFNMYVVTEKIFFYIFDHLSKRFYGIKRMTEIETIENEYSNVKILLNQIHSGIFILSDCNQINPLISQLLNVFNILAKLSGARAVLKGNVIELIFFLKLFQKFNSA